MPLVVLPSPWVRQGYILVGRKLPVGSSLETVLTVGVSPESPNYVEVFNKILTGVLAMEMGDVHIAPEDQDLLMKANPEAFATVPIEELEIDEGRRFTCERCGGDMPDGFCVKCNKQGGNDDEKLDGSGS